MDHPDFRVSGKIFATLNSPEVGWGVVKLTPEQQEQFIQMDPKGFSRVKGGWGAAGATQIRLRTARAMVVNEALLTAWRNRASRRLIEESGR